MASEAPFLIRSTETHHVRVIDDGLADFELRLQMIERASASIDYETYLLRKDTAGQAILSALAAKKSKDPSVRVRLLVDGFGDSFSAVLDPADEAALAKAGVELRYYNPKSGGLPAFWPVGRHNVHNHSKILVVDGAQALLGGRNTADEYFGLSAEYDYVDRDCWLGGPIAASIAQAFDAYWNDARWVKVPKPSKKISAKDAASAEAFLAGSDTAFAVELAKARGLGAARIDKVETFDVNDVTFAQDRPGHASDSDRVVTPVVHDLLTAAAHNVVFEENNLAMSDAKAGIVLAALGRGVRVDALTNSFASSDSLDVARISRVTELKLARAGAQVTHVSGQLPGGAEPLGPETAIAVWGIHTKTVVVDRAALIGSYNSDTRSEQLNNESILVVRDDRVARFVEDRIRARMSETHALKADGTYADGADASPHPSLGHRLTDWIRGPMAVGTFLRSR